MSAREDTSFPERDSKECLRSSHLALQERCEPRKGGWTEPHLHHSCLDIYSSCSLWRPEPSPKTPAGNLGPGQGEPLLFPMWPHCINLDFSASHYYYVSLIGLQRYQYCKVLGPTSYSSHNTKQKNRMKILYPVTPSEGQGPTLLLWSHTGMEGRWPARSSNLTVWSITRVQLSLHDSSLFTQTSHKI